MEVFWDKSCFAYWSSTSSASQKMFKYSLGREEWWLFLCKCLNTSSVSVLSLNSFQVLWLVTGTCWDHWISCKARKGYLRAFSVPHIEFGSCNMAPGTPDVFKQIPVSFLPIFFSLEYLNLKTSIPIQRVETCGGF